MEAVLRHANLLLLWRTKETQRWLSHVHKTTTLFPTGAAMEKKLVSNSQYHCVVQREQW